MSRNGILPTTGKNVEGCELDFFVSKALGKQKYETIRSAMTDFSGWLEA